MSQFSIILLLPDITEHDVIVSVISLYIKNMFTYSVNYLINKTNWHLRHGKARK